MTTLVYLLRAPLWNDATAGARLGVGSDMLALGASSFRCEATASTTQCAVLLGTEALRIEFRQAPTLTCVASYGAREVECVATYVYAPRLKPIAILPSLRSAAPSLWSPSGLLVWLDTALASRLYLFAWFLSLTTATLLGLRVARRNHGSNVRRYSRAMAVAALTWLVAMGTVLISVFVLGYDD